MAHGHEDAVLHPPTGDVEQELHVHGVDLAKGGPSQRRSTTLQASSAKPPSCGTGSCGPTGLNKPDRGLAGDEDRPVDLSLSHPDVQAALAKGRGLKLGTVFKGARLDLTSLQDLQLAEHLLPEVVNGLISAVRCKRTAEVIIDLSEPWTRTKTILGNVDDPVYERLHSRRVGGTHTLIQLRHRRHGRRRVQPSVPPSEANVIVVSSRCRDHALREYEVRLLVEGDPQWRTVVVAADNPSTGAIQATSAALVGHEGLTVALPLKGPFTVLGAVLGQDKKVAGHANTDFSDAVDAMRLGRSWSIQGNWLFGEPCPPRT
jgi:hypothetical protein